MVGANFTFGHRGSGTAADLRELSGRYGATTHSVGLLHEAETRCSSNAVRECLRDGDIHGATRLLGSPPRVEGTFHRFGHGATELVSAPGTALPASGRYLGRLPGAGPVALLVTGEGRVLVESAGVRPGCGSVEFTDRKAAS